MREQLEDMGGFVFRFKTFQDIKDSLREVFGVAADVLLFQAAQGAGRRSCKRMLEKERDPLQVLEKLAELKTIQNWGDIVLKEIDIMTTSGTLVVSRSFESRGVRAKGPNCYFLKGFFAGFLSTLMGRPILVTETECIAAGARRCLFTFRSVK
jgi:predicted hydrocarbon binding protein